MFSLMHTRHSYTHSQTRLLLWYILYSLSERLVGKKVNFKFNCLKMSIWCSPTLLDKYKLRALGRSWGLCLKYLNLTFVFVGHCPGWAGTNPPYKAWASTELLCILLWDPQLTRSCLQSCQTGLSLHIFFKTNCFAITHWPILNPNSNFFFFAN
jgi:hypothetical protein